MEYKKMKHLRLDDTVYALSSNFTITLLKITSLTTSVDTNLMDIRMVDEYKNKYSTCTYKEKRSFQQPSFTIYLDMPSLASSNVNALEGKVKERIEQVEKLETQLLDFRNLLTSYNGFNEGG